MELLPDTSEWRVVKCLLLCLFFTSGEADCPIPVGRNVFVLTDDALLQNSFPDGSHATFECSNGYLRESGSGTVTCTGGQWTEPDLNCKKKDCGPPKQLEHMSFQYIDGGTLFGQSVKAICDKGYQIHGPAYKKCYANGWTGKPKCEVATCEKPGEITNGRSSWDSDSDPEYGAVVRYSCNEGYRLTGYVNMTCSEDGNYSSEPPRCDENGEDDQYSSEPPRRDDGTAMLTTAVNVPLTVGATPSPLTDKMTTTRDTSTALPPTPGRKDSSPPENNLFLTGGTTATDTAISSTNHRDHFTTNKAPSTPPPPSLRGEHGEVDVNKHTGHTAVIASVISTVIVVLIVLYILHRCHMKKKGSYATGEDLKPELLQFQSVDSFTV